MTVPIQTPLNSYTADGKTVLFAYKFYTTEFTDLVVEVNGQTVPKANYTVTGMGGKNGGDVTFKSAPASGAEVVIYRSTPVSRDSEFIDNGDLLADDINREFDRIWLVQQEQKASSAANMTRPTGGGAWDAQKYRIENLAPATLDTDAVTLGQVKQQNNNAFNSATAADGSAKAAAASAVAAAKSAADAATDSADAHQAAVNANTSQLLAQAAAAKAATDATSAAQTQLTTIITPAVQAAQNAQQTALQNAQTAGGYATDAQGYAQTAAGSATGAARSATAAAQSETNAAQSEQLAAQYAQTINTNAIMTAVNKKLDASTYNIDKLTYALKTDLASLATQQNVKDAIANSGAFVKISAPTMQTINSATYWTGFATFGAGLAVTTDAVTGTDVVNWRTMVNYVKNNVTITGFVDDSTNQSVAGIKTFSTGLRVTYNPQNNADVVPKSYVDAAIQGIHIPSLSGLVDLTTAQDITGNKNFQGKVTVQRPTGTNEPVTLGYMGTLLGGMVSKTQDATVGGVKTFTDGLKVTVAPNGDDDVVNQKALNDSLAGYLKTTGGPQSVAGSVLFVSGAKAGPTYKPQSAEDIATKEYVDSAGGWMQLVPVTGLFDLMQINKPGAYLVRNSVDIAATNLMGIPGIDPAHRTQALPYLFELFDGTAPQSTTYTQAVRLTELHTGKVWVSFGSFYGAGQWYQVGGTDWKQSATTFDMNNIPTHDGAWYVQGSDISWITFPKPAGIGTPGYYNYAIEKIGKMLRLTEVESARCWVFDLANPTGSTAWIKLNA